MNRQDSITAAPQAENAFSVLPIWQTGHTGTIDDLWRFLTTPSAERTSFVARHGSMTITGDAATMTIKG